MLSCVYCDENTFEPNHGSEEHAILSSLGGKKASRNICCEECNNRLGDEVDKPFADEFAYFCVMFGVKPGRKQPSLTLKAAVTHEGMPFDVTPGGRFALSKGKVTFEDLPDGTKGIAIVATSREHALTLAQQVLPKYGLSVDDQGALEGVSVRSYLPPQHQRLALGGTPQFRSVAKMLLTYLATKISPARLRSGCFRDVIAFINGCGGKFDATKLGPALNLAHIPTVSDINHRVIIAASEKRQLVVGVLELFGNLRYTVQLSNQWTGPDIAKAYIIDPVTHASTEIDLPQFAPAVLDQYENYEFDKDTAVEAVSNIVRLFQERQNVEQIDSITEAALEKHIDGKVGVAARDGINEFVDEIMNEFQKHLFRQGSTTPVSLQKEPEVDPDATAK